MRGRSRAMKGAKKVKGARSRQGRRTKRGEKASARGEDQRARGSGTLGGLVPETVTIDGNRHGFVLEVLEIGVKVKR